MESIEPLLYAVALLLLGLGLVVLEIFIVSFGLLSVAAVGALAGAVYFAFQAGTVPGWLFTVTAPVAAGLILRAGIKRLAKSKVVPQAEIRADAGYHHLAEQLNVRPGSMGTLVTPARPTGRARFEGGECDVHARGLALESGSKIVVTEIEGPTITVKSA
ncbi:MAG: hypothetical protein ACR2RL_07875 [Gammaproteobacteria bacterium]